MPILSEACCNLYLCSTATICSETFGVILDAHRESHARVMLRVSENESVKKRWLTVESTVFILRHWRLINIGFYQERSLSSLRAMDFSPASPECWLSELCVVRSVYTAENQPVEAWPSLLTGVNFWTYDQCWDRYLFVSHFFFGAVNSTTSTFGISELSNECGKKGCDWIYLLNLSPVSH